MVFLVIDKEFVNKIFTDYDSNIDIDMIEFETKEEAEYYLEYGILMQKNDEIIVFTDGACSKNGAKDAKAGIGVYFGLNDTRNVSKRIQGKQSNNTAEIKERHSEICHLICEMIDKSFK